MEIQVFWDKIMCCWERRYQCSEGAQYILIFRVNHSSWTTWPRRWRQWLFKTLVTTS